MVSGVGGPGNKNPSVKFGDPNGPDPSVAGRKAWSARHAMRYMMAQEIELDENGEVSQTHLKKLGRRTKTANVIAARQIDAALRGDPRAADFVIENVEGKLVQTNLNADLDAVMKADDDELRAIIKEGYALAIRGDSVPGTGEAGNSEEPIASNPEGPSAS